MAQSGYHNVVLPEEWSQGSLFSVSYDTRIIELESGIEERVSRYNPWGRRRYTVNRGIDTTLNIQDLYKFFMLREGSLNSFKFVDPFDNNTSSVGFYTPDDPIASDISEFDENLQFVNGRTYQCVKRYTDGVRTTVRPVTKINQTVLGGAARFAKNGSFDGAASLDTETGLVTFSGVDTILTAQGGYNFYTVVRFGDVTDKAFTIEGQSTPFTQSLPPIELIEVIGDTFISQDYMYGGAIDHGSVSTDITISEVNGRLQSVAPTSSGLKIILPNIAVIPKGGPIVVIENRSALHLMQVLDHNLAGVGDIPAEETKQFFVGASSSTSSGKIWLLV
jgi:uncharacterized protein (TIGR02217 family)